MNNTPEKSFPDASSEKFGKQPFGRSLFKLRTLVWLATPVVIGASFVAISQSSPPAIPAINLSPEPLYAAGTRAKPTLSLALSVEFPTVGAQYVNTPNTNTDNSYAPTTEYIATLMPKVATAMSMTRMRTCAALTAQGLPPAAPVVVLASVVTS